MEKVVDLEERIQSRRSKERLEQFRGKMETVQKLLQCSSCHLKCAMCNAQLQGQDPSTVSHPAHLGLRFCGSCREEFEEFLAITRNDAAPTLFWHNEEWKNMWSAWLDYRRSITAFLRSNEFKLLLEELDS
ncbi:MAG: hypothetical protein AB1512_07870 [Thermodesulfobacteriota bacterium]